MFLSIHIRIKNEKGDMGNILAISAHPGNQQHAALKYNTWDTTFRPVRQVKQC